MISTLFRSVLILIFLAAGMQAQAGVPEGVAAYKSKDFKLAVKELVPPAGEGNPVALFYIALMYENGEGLQQNFPQAMKLYRRAADLGYAPAQCNLGYMYETEAGTERNYKDAAFWYRKAAEQGYAVAQFNLGLMYYVGRGSDAPRSFRTAVSWYRKAAEQGYAPAQNALGKMFESGLGTLVSLTQADMWYILAEEAGSEQAFINRKMIELKMDPDMLEEAQSYAIEWRASHK